jgi:hypothetical protein
MNLGGLLGRLKRAQKAVKLWASPAEDAQRFARYQADPLAYARDVLKVTLTADQEAIALAGLEPPRKVIVKSGHNIGKTFLEAVLANWHFDCFRPSLTITTAPTDRDVKDLLWKEIRTMRLQAGLGGLMPAAAEMRSGHNHYAKGYTANKGESFQGRHDGRMMFLFDEATGLEGHVYTPTGTMFNARLGHIWYCFCNPTDTNCHLYLEDVGNRGGWRSFSLSSMDHPNIMAQLRGEPLPVPNAVSVEQINDWVAQWCDPVEESDRESTDFQWPPEEFRDRSDPPMWWRPGPQYQSRVLGLWPSAGTYGVWSELLWNAACQELPAPTIRDRLVIGCDVARYGDDYTSIHVRHGTTSLHHETHNGWGVDRTIARLQELCRQYAAYLDGLRSPYDPRPSPYDIPVFIDDDGVGGGVTDGAGGYTFLGVNAQTAPHDETNYPDRRSELWFALAERARHGELSVARLKEEHRLLLMRQAMAPRWDPVRGRRCVQSKEKIKKDLGRSPDDMDAMNLAYCDPMLSAAPQSEPTPKRDRTRPVKR